MASAASQSIEEVTAYTQSDSLEDPQEIWADGTYFLNNLRTCRLENGMGCHELFHDLYLLASSSNSFI